MPHYAERRTIMVDTQIRTADVTRFPIIEAMLAVPRETFVPAASREIAYAGTDLPLGQGRVMLDPRTLAKMIEILDIGLGSLVLDVGCGPGYGAAILGRMAEAVVAVEEDTTLAREAERALAAVGADNVAVVTAPLVEGVAKHGPYDAMIVEGGIAHLPPALKEQLKEGGRVVALFMEGELGEVRLGIRSGGQLTWRFGFNASAPLLPGFAATPEFAL